MAQPNPSAVPMTGHSERRLRRSCRVAALLAGMAVLLSVVACSGATDHSLDDRIRASLIEESRAAQRRGFYELGSVLEDGHYTDAEHAKMLSLYEKCLAKAGYRLGPRQKNPIDGRSYESEIVNLDEVDDPDGAHQRGCLTRYLDQSAIQEQPGEMAVPLRRLVQACLAKAGYRVDRSDHTAREIITRAGRAAEAVFSTCIDDAMAAEYPDFPGHGRAIPAIY